MRKFLLDVRDPTPGADAGPPPPHADAGMCVASGAVCVPGQDLCCDSGYVCDTSDNGATYRCLLPVIP